MTGVKPVEFAMEFGGVGIIGHVKGKRNRAKARVLVIHDGDSIDMIDEIVEFAGEKNGGFTASLAREEFGEAFIFAKPVGLADFVGGSVFLDARIGDALFGFHTEALFDGLNFLKVALDFGARVDALKASFLGSSILDLGANVTPVIKLFSFGESFASQLSSSLCIIRIIAESRIKKKRVWTAGEYYLKRRAR